jgi:hypothetical protein
MTQRITVLLLVLIVFSGEVAAFKVGNRATPKATRLHVVVPQDEEEASEQQPMAAPAKWKSPFNDRPGSLVKKKISSHCDKP